ncbi:MAG: hypothetical protein BWY38_03184 [Ignavibacteria bacterium ADurb.Bin266]|jgi:hypothetical protein|nr:MAG: hypothetical protein BWY38_03184 [Ignavibacteria bacterium ADurb.Bin266]
MVKIISITNISLFIFLACFSQEATITTKEVDFNAYFSKDTVCFNDTVEIKLIYKNKTDYDIKLFFPTYSRIYSTAIGHKFQSYFIFEDSASRILYNLKNTLDSDTMIILKPNKTFIKAYKVIVTPVFFYRGKNNLYVFHRIWKYPMLSSNRREREKKPYLSFTSSSDLWLYVESCVTSTVKVFDRTKFAHNQNWREDINRNLSADSQRKKSKLTLFSSSM